MMAKILIVEDEPEVRLLSKSLLEILGHSVDEVGSGERAIMLIHTREYDLVLSDIGLPGMDGWAVAQKIKQHAPHTKVGLVSGWEIPPHPEQLRAQGVDFLLPKPFSLDEVEEALAHYLP